MANANYNPAPIPQPIKCAAKDSNGTRLPTVSTDDVIVGDENYTFAGNVNNLTKALNDIKNSINDAITNLGNAIDNAKKESFIYIYLEGSDTVNNLFDDYIDSSFVNALLARITARGNISIVFHWSDGAAYESSVSKYVSVSDTEINIIFVGPGYSGGSYTETLYAATIVINDGQYVSHTVSTIS